VKIRYTSEALTDLVDALTYLVERNPDAARSLDDEIEQLLGRLAAGEFEGPISRLRSGSEVRTWSLPPFRIYYLRSSDELVVLRIYHQAREPIE